MIDKRIFIDLSLGFMNSVARTDGAMDVRSRALGNFLSMRIQHLIKINASRRVPFSFISNFLVCPTSYELRLQRLRRRRYLTASPAEAAAA